MKLLLITFLLLISVPAHAHLFSIDSYQAHGPIPARTQNPLYLLFITDWPTDTHTLAKNKWALDLESSYSSIFEYNPRATGIGMDVDMESLRNAFNIRYGLFKNFEIGIHIPLVSFFGGFLDPFIQAYHNFWGLPNAGRNLVGNNRFNFEITQNGNPLMRADDEPLGLADLTLWQKWALVNETKFRPSLAVKNMIKFPTGRQSQATGSGNGDWGFGVIAEKNIRRLHLYTQAGLLVFGGHDTLDPFLKPMAMSFAQTVEFNLFNHVSLVAQINGSTPIFENVGINDAGIHDLADPLLDLMVGFAGEFPSKGKHRTLYYRAGFGEDPLSSGPSVDFTVFLNAGVRY